MTPAIGAVSSLYTCERSQFQAFCNTMQFHVTGHTEIRSQYVTLFALKSLYGHSCGIISKYCNIHYLGVSLIGLTSLHFRNSSIHCTSSQCTFLTSLRHIPNGSPHRPSVYIPMNFWLFQFELRVRPILTHISLRQEYQLVAAAPRRKVKALDC